MKSFFGAVDRNVKGDIASELPAWMHEANLRQMEEEHESIERQIERGDIDPGDVPYQRQEAAKLKERTQAIRGSRPEMPDGDRDAIAKSRKELIELIRDKQYTVSEMKKGTASAHQEAKFMSEPCVKLSGKVAEMAQANGIPITSNGLVSRTQAERLYRMSSAYLGEDTSVESFRRERNTKNTSHLERGEG